MQPADIAVVLRRRSPWEATDLGVAMLQRWWRPAYAAHALVLIPLVAVLLAAAWAADAVWAAMLAIWWLEPLYDRAVLHVLSRAVFGAVPSPGFTLRSIRQWCVGLPGALTFDRFDLARSFNLAVRQLEGQRGRAARERRSVLGRRARGEAVWLTVVWVHFEAVLMGSAAAAAGLALPAQLDRGQSAGDAFLGGLGEALKLVSAGDVLVYAAVLLVLEPFYVAAGFALYLNRRTLLEGWDIEVALRRIAEKHAGVLIFLLSAVVAVAMPAPIHAQEKNPGKEIAEVLKAPEFGHYRETARWQPRDPSSPRETDSSWLRGVGYALAKAAEVLLWVAAAAAVAYALWWAARLLPRVNPIPKDAYAPPPALFGMELAPEKLPPNLAEAAAALAREGHVREALGLLYRGALSELAHKRGVELLASHTEGEAAGMANLPYFTSLVEAWRGCAYANRTPSPADIERLAREYQATFA